MDSLALRSGPWSAELVRQPGGAHQSERGVMHSAVQTSSSAWPPPIITITHGKSVIIIIPPEKQTTLLTLDT